MESETIYQGEGHRLVIRSFDDRPFVVVAHEPKGSSYMGGSPHFYERWWPPGARTWWKPWTWLGPSLPELIGRGIHVVDELDGKRAAGAQVVDSVADALEGVD